MPDEKDNQKIEYEVENEDGGESADLAEKIKKLKEQLKQCQKEKQEYLGGWQRCQADFINYRRRQEEQVGEWIQVADEKIIREILPVLDTLESFSRGHADHEDKLEKKHLTEGLAGVRKQLMDILSKNGIKEIKAVGEKFNPEIHEAMEQVESEKEEGMIVEEMQKGYLLNGRVIRPAKVKISK